MKIGIISDIHSNIDALDAVLEEFNKIEVDKIICCGDIIGIGPKPEECVKKIISMKDKIIVVRGNHENYFINGIPETIHDDKRKLREEEKQHHKWIQNQLSEESKEFIKALPEYKIVDIENKKIFIVHYPLKLEGGYKKHISIATIEECEDMFSDNNADVYLFGHTHKENVNTNNIKWYINPGSLGCPLSSNYAKAGILEVEENKIYYHGINVEYDANKVIKDIEKIGYPEYKNILKLFYGKN